MSGHHHASSSHTLLWALAITLAFAFVEAVGGWLANSLALMGDAGHMLTDASALGLAAFAAWLAKRPPSTRHTYGLARAEVLAALVNSLFMLAIVAAIVIAAIDRFNQPDYTVAGEMVIVIALIGLVVNLIVAWVLHQGEQTLNIRAALLHVIGDLLGSVAALIAGVVIYFTDWYMIDPILSILICVLILYSSVRLLREVVHIIMEGVPQGMDLTKVGAAMASADGVQSVHDLHIWTVASGTVAMSAHVVVKDINNWQPVLTHLQLLLHEEFNIDHTTIQPEPDGHVTKPALESPDHGPEWQG